MGSTLPFVIDDVLRLVQSEHWKQVQLDHPVPASAVCEEVVTRAVDASRLDPIRQLSMGAKAELAQEITSIAADAKLYGSQLDAFCQGLMSAVHCTQGPPGTGKVGDDMCILIGLFRNQISL